MLKVKKKVYILLICAVMLGVSGCSNADREKNDLEINEEEIVIPDAYESVLNNTFKLIVDMDPDYVCDEGEISIVESMIGKSASEGLDSIGYTIIDIDENGVDELVIAEKSDDGKGNRILDIYTIKDDKAFLIIEGFVRDRYYLLDDNTIYNEGSGGAAYTMFGVYELLEDGITLSAIDYYFSDYQDEEMTEWGWFHNKDGKSNKSQSEWMEFKDENEPFNMMSDYLDRTQKLELTYLIDYDFISR